ncbi:hypothetical protein M8C21_029276, partial [Ambrosia artemisiifolia]
VEGRGGLVAPPRWRKGAEHHPWTLVYRTDIGLSNDAWASDSVAVTFAECNLDFNYLTGNHPRECDKFYHLIPLLGCTTKVSDYITIPVFAVQVTLFPNHGISIGMTNHHSLGDASTRFCFLKAWTSIAQSGGSDEQFVADGTLPIYDRLLKYPKIDESYVKNVKVETFNEEYKLPRLSGPTDKPVRMSGAVQRKYATMS